MNLRIKKYEEYERPWLLKRVDGKYEQHCHFRTYEEAEEVKHLIEIRKYPKNKCQKLAMQRILTEEEFKSLDKKQRYFNPNKGIR